MKENCINCSIRKKCSRYKAKSDNNGYCPYWYPSHEAEKRDDYKEFIENNNLDYDKQKKEGMGAD